MIMSDFIMAASLFVIVFFALAMWWVIHEERNRSDR